MILKMKSVYIEKPEQILNERKWIDYIINNNYIDPFKPGWTLILYAKHLYYDLEYQEKDIPKALEAFARENRPGIKLLSFKGMNAKEDLMKILKNFTKTAVSNPIHEIDGIWITEKELSVISTLNDKVLERCAFVFLCYAKLLKARNENANGWVYYNLFPEIIESGRLNCSMNSGDRCLSGYIHKLNKAGLLEPEGLNAYNFAEPPKFRVTFMDFENEGIIYIDDWRELGYYYRRYKGENIIKCERCGIMTRGNKNHTKKYCTDCTGKQNKKMVPQYVNQYQCIDCKGLFYFNPGLGERARKRCPSCLDKERKEHNRTMYEKRKAKKQEEIQPTTEKMEEQKSNPDSLETC